MSIGKERRPGSASVRPRPAVNRPEWKAGTKMTLVRAATVRKPGTLTYFAFSDRLQGCSGRKIGERPRFSYLIFLAGASLPPW